MWFLNNIWLVFPNCWVTQFFSFQNSLEEPGSVWLLVYSHTDPGCIHWNDCCAYSDLTGRQSSFIGLSWITTWDPSLRVLLSVLSPGGPLAAALQSRTCCCTWILGSVQSEPAILHSVRSVLRFCGVFWFIERFITYVYIIFKCNRNQAKRLESASPNLFYFITWISLNLATYGLSWNSCHLTRLMVHVGCCSCTRFFVFGWW